MKNIFILLAIVLAQAISAQEVAEIKSISLDQPLERLLNRDVEAYAKYTKAKDFNKLVDYLLPSLLNSFGKEGMVEQFEKMDNEAFSFRFNRLDFERPDIILKGEPGIVTVLDYTNNFSLIFVKNNTMTEEEFSNYLDLMHNIFSTNTYKDGKVALDKPNATITVELDKKMIAVMAKNTEVWKFIEYDPVSNYFLEEAIGNVFSKKVIASITANQ